LLVTALAAIVTGLDVAPPPGPTSEQP
jgi:hypothetical protein